MMTEDEAKTKWCPFQGSYEAGSRCKASGCTVWRWQELQADDDYLAAVVKAAEEIGDTTTSKHKAAKHVTQNRAHYGLPTKPYLGGCGLASH
jgi:hypothetical protein